MTNEKENMYKLINFAVRGDYAGSLVPIESNQDIPFDIKRVYYIWGTDYNAVRGRHAHRHLEQVIICIAGSCDFILENIRKIRYYYAFSGKRLFPCEKTRFAKYGVNRVSWQMTDCS